MNSLSLYDFENAHQIVIRECEMRVQGRVEVEMWRSHAQRGQRKTQEGKKYFKKRETNSIYSFLAMTCLDLGRRLCDDGKIDVNK